MTVRIAHVASEVVPFAKTGGLADVLGALPPALVVIMSIINPALMRVLFTDPLGHLLIGLGVIMQGTGYLLMRKVIHIEV